MGRKIRARTDEQFTELHIPSIRTPRASYLFLSIYFCHEVATVVSISGTSPQISILLDSSPGFLGCKNEKLQYVLLTKINRSNSGFPISSLCSAKSPALVPFHSLILPRQQQQVSPTACSLMFNTVSIHIWRNHKP